MKIKLIAGGQSGADAGALRAARIAGIPTGGYAPRGWLTEYGPMPWLLRDCFGLTEHPTADYAARTHANCEIADAGIWFGDPTSPGGKLTRRVWREERVPWFEVPGTIYPAIKPRTRDVVDWIEQQPVSGGVLVLMAGGNRESKNPGIGARVEEFMLDVFRILAGNDRA